MCVFSGFLGKVYARAEVKHTIYFERPYGRPTEFLYLTGDDFSILADDIGIFSHVHVCEHLSVGIKQDYRFRVPWTENNVFLLPSILMATSFTGIFSSANFRMNLHKTC